MQDTQSGKRKPLKAKSGLTKRAPDAGDSGAIPSIFLRLSFFPVGRRSAARPSAGNANRWAVPRKTMDEKSKCQFGFGNHFHSMKVCVLISLGMK